MTTELKAREVPASYVLDILHVRSGYKQTEVGVIPEDWEVKPLGELTTTVASGRSKPNATYGNYAVHGSTGVIGYSDTAEYKGDAVLVARVGANAGKLNIVSGEYGVTDNTIIVRFGSGSSLSFFWRQMESKNLNSLVFGSGQPLITGTQLKALAVCVPPLPEQRAIAAALSDVDALLAKLDQLIAKKRDLKQAAMQQLLTGSTRLPGFGGEWEVKPLKDICWFQEGPGVRNYQFTKRGVKLLNGTNISNGRVVLDTTDRHISEEEAFGCYKHFLVDDGDILIASSGVTIDKFHEKVAFASSENLPLCMNTSTIRFKTNSSELLDKYLYLFLQSDLFKVPIGKQATGSAQLNFGPAHLNKINLKLPPTLEEQTAIATVLSDMDAEIAALEARRDKTRDLKQGMMQELLTGRIRLV